MVQPSGKERAFYKDEAGNYWVQTADMPEPVQVPRDKSSEVEQVIGGGDTTGFVSIGSIGGTSLVQHSGHQLSALGKCNGECGRTFGVLGTQQFRG